MWYYIQLYIHLGNKLISTSFLGFKFVLAIVLSFVLCLIYIIKKYFPNIKSNDNFMKFQLKNNFEYYLNIFWVGLYFLIFVVGILSLRLTNLGRQTDLKPFWNKLKFFFTTADWMHIIINVYLLILLVYCFYKLLEKIILFFKMQLLKNKIDLMRFKRYSDYCFNGFLYKNYNMYHLLFMFYIKYQKPVLIYFYSEVLDIKDYFPQSEPFITKIRFYMLYYLHYFILFYVIYYDMRHNNLILTKMYTFLPIFFLYFLWVKISIFYRSKNDLFDRFLSFVYYVPAVVESPQIKNNRFSITYFFPWNFETYTWTEDEIRQINLYVDRNLIALDFTVHNY